MQAESSEPSKRATAGTASAVATSGAPQPLDISVEVPESAGYRLKKHLLGPPLVNRQLHAEKLSNKVALGVLASDCISSSAYGSEEMLRILVPVVGVAAFTLLMPVTYAILGILLLLTLSYRDVVTAYTKAGGSYVVARENFGPRVAQIAAVALLIDYVVTVAVQTAAGTDAIASLFHLLWGIDISSEKLWICLGVVAILFYGNLRGIKEAGRAFAAPAYLFMAGMALVFIVAAYRMAVNGGLPHADIHASGAISVGTQGNGLLYGASLFVVLKAFANGGSSLTGLEAISNSVSAFRKPAGINARKTLVAMSICLAVLVFGVSLLARLTHAIPYESGDPTVIAQEAQLVFGTSWLGHAGLVFVQLGTALILWTGANTPFNGFPFLASFVAEDQFLPRQLRTRGHRLAFSNGIIVLTLFATLLLVATDAKVDALVAFYAIGVFTGFTMAGAGLTKHHYREREGRWRLAMVVNFLASVVSALVVLIFAVTKFTEGAWLVVFIFPLGVWLLIRVNRRYRDEAAALAAAPATSALPTWSRSVVLVLVDGLDLSVLKALRYARSLRPNELRAVHFMIDNKHAERLREKWDDSRAADVRLEIIECPDRRLKRAAQELAARTVSDGATEVTLLLPRRTYPAVLRRLLHGRVADELAAGVAKVPHAAATIVPFDVAEAIEEVKMYGQADIEPPVPSRMRARAGSPVGGTAHDGRRRINRRLLAETDLPDDGYIESNDPVPVGELKWRQRAVVEGRVRAVSSTPISGAPSLECELFDATGGLTLVFYGRRAIPGLKPGAAVRAEGMVGEHEGYLAMANPTYEILPGEPGEEEEEL